MSLPETPVCRGGGGAGSNLRGQWCSCSLDKQGASAQVAPLIRRSNHRRGPTRPGPTARRTSEMTRLTRAAVAAARRRSPRPRRHRGAGQRVPAALRARRRAWCRTSPTARVPLHVGATAASRTPAASRRPSCRRSRRRPRTSSRRRATPTPPRRSTSRSTSTSCSTVQATATSRTSRSTSRWPCSTATSRARRGGGGEHRFHVHAGGHRAHRQRPVAPGQEQPPTAATPARVAPTR